MKRVRFGIIGMGNIGKYHADYLLNGKVLRAELSAVCATNPAPLEKYRPRHIFTDGAQLIRSGLVDAVIIATPHFQHSPLGIMALENGVHPLLEKPIAAHKADAEKLIAVHRKFPKLVLGGMFQLRTEPRYLKIRQLLRAGELGEIVRINWINTDWFRTEAYYASGGWRATWAGEGGGVLLNQCLHNLDLLQWLCGQPRRVRGFCQFGRFHQIEVEDAATIYLEWPGGTTGVFIGSTGEAPGTNRLEITGTKGRLVLENNRLMLTRNDADMLEFSRTAPQGFLKPAATNEEISFTDADCPHALITQNFVNAILDGEPLLAPGAEGIHSVELANAALHSSLLGQTLELPLAAADWQRQLEKLIAGAKPKQTVVAVAADDFTSSFRK